MSMSSNPLQRDETGSVPVSLPIAKLEIRRGWARHKTRPIAVPVFLIGTGTDCDLVLGDLQFPEVYCYVFLDPAGLSIRWLGKGPQLVVDGQAVQSAELTSGSLIEMGGYEFGLSVLPPLTSNSDPIAELVDECDAEADDCIEGECISIVDMFEGAEVPSVDTPQDLDSTSTSFSRSAKRVLPSDEAFRTSEQLLADVLAVTCIREREQVRELLRDIRRVIADAVDLRLYVEPEVPATDSL